MLKFFRKYMKYILAVFVAILMIAFLIQPTLSMFGPDPAGEVVGTIGTDRITRGQQHQASAQLQIIEQFSPMLLTMGGLGQGQGHEALRWTLALHDARAMGLAASQVQVDDLLKTMGRSETELARVARAIGVSVDAVRMALEDWITLQSYRELVNGVVHLPVSQRLVHLATALQFMQFGYKQGAVEIELAVRGAPRLSEPLLERFLDDHQATVRITAAAIPCDRYLPQVTPPDEKTLAEIFDSYKASLPGEGKPYRLGYRMPDRVKIEYLTIPFDRVRDKVRVEEADALSYYDSHRDQFQSRPAATQPGQDQAGDEPSVKPYDQVRGRIIDLLKSERAKALSDQMIKVALAILLEDARALGERGGYRVIPGNWQPVELERVVAQLQQKFEVLPDVHRYDGRWLAASDLARLPGIGDSKVVVGQKSEPFVPYVLSARELLAADGEHRLGSLRLQAQMPSIPLVAADGAGYLFRVIDAQANRIPASIEEVRSQVVHDAKRIAAYKLLQQQRQDVLEHVRAQGLERWAAQEGLAVHQPPPFPKRLSVLGGQLRVPNIPGLGNSQAFIDGVFDLVDWVGEATPSQAASLMSDSGMAHVPAPGRIGAIMNDQEMGLVLVRIDELEPMTRDQYQSDVRQSWVGAWIDQLLTGRNRQDALSLDALSKKVGFEPADSSDQSSDESDTGGTKAIGTDGGPIAG